MAQGGSSSPNQPLSTSRTAHHRLRMFADPRRFPDSRSLCALPEEGASGRTPFAPSTRTPASAPQCPLHRPRSAAPTRPYPPRPTRHSDSQAGCRRGHSARSAPPFEIPFQTFSPISQSEPRMDDPRPNQASSPRCSRSDRSGLSLGLQRAL